MRRVRFRTLGCYPLTGAIQSDADTLDEDHRRNARLDDFGAPGPADRPRRERARWRRRSARDISDGPTHPALSDALPTPRLRLLTCGSVDDGKSTLIGRLLYEQKLIFDDQLAALEARFEEARHDRRRHRFRAAGRRARGRARAGHHDRRRLSLFRDAARAPSSSPTRPATSNIRATWRPAPPTPNSP